MKIRYNGPFAVDIKGHDNVQPGQTVDVSDELGASLLLAGCSVVDGKPIAPASPVWSRAGKTATTADTTTAEPANEPAPAGKES